MAIKFLKKLADKLLGRSSADHEAPKKAEAKKESHGRGGGTHGKHDRSGQRHEADAKGNGWAARSARKSERHEGGRQGGHPSSRNGHPHAKHDAPHGPKGPRPESPGRTQESDEKVSHEPHGSRRSEHGRTQERGPQRAMRQGPRPSGPGRRERGEGGSVERVNTAPDAQRPGGAVADSELEKRRAEHAAWTLDLYQVPTDPDKKRFHDFDLPLEIMHAVADKGFQYCTPIQSMSLEHALAGKNVAGKAQTGTGKTAAFLVAILTRYLRTPEGRADKGGRPRALVIAPTRELVIQICKDADELGKYCGLRSLAVYGGMDYDRQKREVMDAPVDLLVATPGRLLDFVRSRVIDLSMVDTLVIDEADRMLDMGFIPDVRSIIHRLPPKEKRCTMLYSATLSDDVMRLAAQWMEEPVRVEVESEQVTTKTVKQVVYVVTSNEKFTVLYNHIQQFPDSRILVFCNRRTTTDDVAESLLRRGVRCDTLSGDVNQNRRLRVLEDFRSGKTRIVVATDVAGRGLHVDDIGFVINFDFPYAPEDYVHRIGRTGRAGQSGVAISFADEDESFTIPDIEKFIGEELKCTMLKSDDPLLTPIPKVCSRSRRGAPGKEESAEKSAETAPQQEEVTEGEDQAPASAFTEGTSGTGATVRPQPVPQAEPPAPAPVIAEQTARAVEATAAPMAVIEKPAEPVTQPEPRPTVRPSAPAPARPMTATRPGRFSEEWVPGGDK